MAFSQSFGLGNSTFMNLDQEVLNALKKDEAPPRGVLDVIDESPTNSKKKLTKAKAKQSTQYSIKRRKKFERSKSDSTLHIKNEKTFGNVDVDKDVAAADNYSEFFKSDFSLGKQTSLGGMESHVNISQIEAICQRVENEKVSKSTEIGMQKFVDPFDDSGGFTQLLEQGTQKVSEDNSSQKSQHLEICDKIKEVESTKTNFIPEVIDFFNDSGGFSQLLEKPNQSQPLESSKNIPNPDEPIFSEDFNEVFDKSVNTKNSLPAEVEEIINIDDSSFFFVGTQNERNMLEKELEESRKVLQQVSEDRTARRRSRMPVHTPTNLSTCENSVLVWSVCSDESPEMEMAVDNRQIEPSRSNNDVVEEVHRNDYEVRTNLEDLKRLSAWSLPAAVLNEYDKKGIGKMFDWQVECLSNPKVLFEHKNLVYSAPTSAGKTLVSEILMIKTILERDKKVILILPFISVVREKMFYLQDLLTPSGYRVEGFFGGYSPPGGFDSINVAICTIEKANSIINKLLEQGKLSDIGIVVVDEIHLISDPGRGYILELLLAKILYMSQKYALQIQIVTMSATLANVELLKKWLNAELFITEFRPVELREMIKIGTKIYDNQLNFIRDIISEEFKSLKDQDHVIQLTLETIMEGCSVVIFCPSKDWCENLCLQLAQNIHNFIKIDSEVSGKVKANLKKDLLEEVKAQMKDIPTGLDSVLSKTITYGCAFHHAGLTTEERDAIEASFKSGALKVIVATSTLSSGVNLPARRVIIRSPLFAGKQMNSLTYKQMIGRAGRTGKDTLGESILICPENNSKVGKDLIGADLKPISSCLEMQNSTHLKRALLEVISASVATTQDDIDHFVRCTLLSTQKYMEEKEKDKSDESRDTIMESINFLKEYEFIRLQLNEESNEMNYVATRLGMACLASSMPPSDGLILFAELQNSRRCFVLESELHAVYLVTPYSVCYQMSDIDWLFYLDLWEKLSPAMKKVGELVGVKESFLVRAMRGQTNLDYKLMQIHKRFYTSLALQELVNETPINAVALKFKCNRGLLQSLQQMASTFAGIVTAFCNSLHFQTLSLIVSQFKERLFFGVHRDLIDLMRLPGLNYKRARGFFDAGIESLVDLANTDVFTVEKILHDSLSFDSAKKHDHEDEHEADQRNRERNMYMTGKSGLTVKDAARQMVVDARLFVQYEIGVKNINWSQVSEDTAAVNVSRAKRKSHSNLEGSSPKSSKVDEVITELKPTMSVINNYDTNDSPITDNIVNINEKNHKLPNSHLKVVDNIKIRRNEEHDKLIKCSYNQLKEPNKIISKEKDCTVKLNINKQTERNIPKSSNNAVILPNRTVNVEESSKNEKESNFALNKNDNAKSLNNHCKVSDRNVAQGNINEKENEHEKPKYSYNQLKQPEKIVSIEKECTILLNKNKESSNQPVKLPNRTVKEEKKYESEKETSIALNKNNERGSSKSSDKNSAQSTMNERKEELSVKTSNNNERARGTRTPNKVNIPNKQGVEENLIPSKMCEHKESTKVPSPSCIRSHVKIKTPIRPSSAGPDLNGKPNSYRRSPRNHPKTNEVLAVETSKPRENITKEVQINRREIKEPIVVPTNKEDIQLLDDTSFEMDSALQNALDTPNDPSSSITIAANTSTDEIASSQDVNAEQKTQCSRFLRSYRAKREEKEIDSSSKSKSSTIEVSDLSIENSIIKNPIQLNSSHIMSISKTEPDSASFDRIEIIDICGNILLFKNAIKELCEAQNFGVSIAVEKHLNKRKPLIGGNLLINQINDQKTEKELDFSVNDDSYIAGISFCLTDNVVYYMNMQTEGSGKGLTNHMKLEGLKKVFSDDNIIFKVFDAKEQLKVLRKAMPELPKFNFKIEDPKVANWLLQPDKNLNLHNLAQQFAPECTSLTHMVVKNRGYNSIGLDCNIGVIGKIRSSIESCVTVHILRGQIENLERIGSGQLYKFFTDLEMPIQMSLYQMEYHGFPADEAAFRDLFQRMMETMKILESKIFELHGSRFNLASSSAVARVLGLHKKANGRYSTSKQILEKIDSPMSLLILDYRKLSIMLSKTTQPLLKMIVNGRVYGESVTFTSTGRISMHAPNLQNVAKDFHIELSGEKRLISCRGAFFPSSGRCLLSSDFCQMEMRILAHLSQDSALLRAMNSETDVFTSISAKWNKIAEEDVSETLRNGTKQLCYGIIYGMGMRTLAETLKCTEQEAMLVSEQFHLAYPGIRTYIQKVIKFAKHNGYIETITGRRRYLDNINSPETQLRGQAERQAVNSTIQGSAADISKSAILRMEKNITKYRDKIGIDDSSVNLVLHMHDELIFEVPEDRARKIAKVLSITMENCVKLSVPLRVKLKMGRTWGNLKEIRI